MPAIDTNAQVGYRAGRYILIKLWATCPARQIDIQAITAHGYGGPRFFPAVEMR